MAREGWKWLEWVDTAILNEDGYVTAILGVGRDINDKKQMELEYVRKDGVTRWFENTLKALRDENGQITGMISSQIFAGPLRCDENWNPQPYLAKSWKVSKDGRSLTLHLVEGATFHDGHPVTSENPAFSVMAVKEYGPFFLLALSHTSCRSYPCRVSSDRCSTRRFRQGVVGSSPTESSLGIPIEKCH